MLVAETQPGNYWNAKDQSGKVVLAHMQVLRRNPQAIA
ncbi:MAG: hypothetical protein H6Q52_2091 [Deltaproteobacteria bacterium]|nr:hypothetical protein [Deltaproteobacteria bacterium]